MKNTLRILSLLLVVLMIGALLAACGKNKDKDGTGENTPPPVANDDPYADELPAELDYGGATVTILSSQKDTVKVEFYAEGDSANAIESAVFKRNETVKERLNVGLYILLDDASKDVTNIEKRIESTVTAGDTTFDVAVGPTYRMTANVNNGHFRNLKNCTYMNLNKYYWSQGFNSALSYGNDKQYIANGSIVLSIYRCLDCTIFNKTMFGDKQETNLYEVVRNGEWTMEYQLNVSKRLATGTANPDSAIYGMAAGLKVSVDPYWVSLNAPLVNKDANNHFQYAATNRTASNKIITACKAILDLYSDASCFVAPNANDSFSNVDNNYAHMMFCDKRAAMSTTVIYNIERTTQQLGDIDYGIVPMPMLDKNQGAYYTGVQDQVSALGIINTVTDDRLQMVGAVLECLASESYKTVVEEYYENIMQYRFAQDVDTQEMLTIIYEGSCMPLTGIYTGVLNENIGSGVTTFLRNIIEVGVSSGGQNPASTQLSTIKNTMPKNVETLNKAFEDLEPKKEA